MRGVTKGAHGHPASFDTLRKHLPFRDSLSPETLRHYTSCLFAPKKTHNSWIIRKKTNRIDVATKVPVAKVIQYVIRDCGAKPQLRHGVQFAIFAEDVFHQLFQKINKMSHCLLFLIWFVMS